MDLWPPLRVSVCFIIIYSPSFTYLCLPSLRHRDIIPMLTGNMGGIAFFRFVLTVVPRTKWIPDSRFIKIRSRCDDCTKWFKRACQQYFKNTILPLVSTYQRSPCLSQRIS